MERRRIEKERRLLDEKWKAYVQKVQQTDRIIEEEKKRAKEIHDDVLMQKEIEFRKRQKQLQNELDKTVADLSMAQNYSKALKAKPVITDGVDGAGQEQLTRQKLEENKRTIESLSMTIKDRNETLAREREAHFDEIQTMKIRAEEKQKQFCKMEDEKEKIRRDAKALDLDERALKEKGKKLENIAEIRHAVGLEIRKLAAENACIEADIQKASEKEQLKVYQASLEKIEK